MGLMDLFKTPNAGGAFPSQPKRGGFLGTGLDGEDVMNTLLRAASIAQGDYESGAQFGANIGARKRQREQQALLQSAIAQSGVSPDIAALAELAPQAFIEQRLKGALEQPERTNAYKEYRDMGYTDAEAQEQMRRDALGRRTKLVTPNENAGAGIWSPEAGYKSIVEPNPGDVPMGTPVTGGNIPRVSSPQEAMRLPPGSKFMTPDGRIGTVPGGGVSNGPGNFRR